VGRGKLRGLSQWVQLYTRALQTLKIYSYLTYDLNIHVSSWIDLKKVQNRRVSVPAEVPIKTTSKSEPSVVTTWGSTSRAVKPVYNPVTRKIIFTSAASIDTEAERYYCRAGLIRSKLVLAMNNSTLSCELCTSLLWTVWKILGQTYADGHSDAELLKSHWDVTNSSSPRELGWITEWSISPFTSFSLTGKGFILKTRWKLITGTKEDPRHNTRASHHPNTYINLDPPNFSLPTAFNKLDKFKWEYFKWMRMRL